MSRAALSIACGVFAVQILSCAAVPAEGPATAANNAAGSTVVQFSFESVSPETVEIPADGNLTWVNNAADTRAQVVFPLSIASAFTCTNLEPNFRKTSAGYQSLPINAEWSPQTERISLPCSLRPGRYDYQVWIENSGLGQTEGSGPGRTLNATIIVD